ncbi:MAG: DUF3365 domain-containing protein [Anaeromyxobacteraceae bacterium]
MHVSTLWLSLSLAASPGSASSAARATFSPDEAPEALQPAIAKADAATQILQRRLSGRLGEAMKEGGPARAVKVCRDEASRIAGEVSAKSGVALGRTTDRLRSARNAPPAWAQPIVEAARGKRASDVKPVAVDLGDRVGVLRPIAVGGACLGCHGTPDRIAPDVKAHLAAAYPRDAANGYAEGDHRGFFWAEVAR